MLISADIKGLEVVTAAYLSQCPVLRQELLEGRDLHEDNRIKFNLGTRDTAKRFKFKMIYGGTAHGFTSDTMFLHLNYNTKQWQEIIDDYFRKYYGLAKWHNSLLSHILDEGIYESPSGRTYDYRDLLKKYQEWYWLPKIKNYPVQGLGADIVQQSRIELYRRMRQNKAKSLLVNTIHDSIILDCPLSELGLTGVASTVSPENKFQDRLDKPVKPCYNIREEIVEVFKDLPGILSREYSINFDLPIQVEIKTLTTQEKL